MKIRFLHSSLGTLVATLVTIRTTDDVDTARVVDSETSRRLIDAARLEDPSTTISMIHYARTGVSAILNLNLEQCTMDILAQLETSRRVSNAKTDKPRIMLAPKPDEVPEDGVLKYVVVSGVAELANLEAGVVYLFGSDSDSVETLSVLVDHPNLFPFTPIVLDGVARADYGAAFTTATWMCEKVSYHTLIGDVTEETRRRVDIVQRDEKPFDKERRARTTKTGDVRPFTKFGVTTPDLRAEDESVAED